MFTTAASKEQLALALPHLHATVAQFASALGLDDPLARSAKVAELVPVSTVPEINATQVYRDWKLAVSVASFTLQGITSELMILPLVSVMPPPRASTSRW